MEHVSAVEVYTTKFSHSMFLLRIWENFMPTEKVHFNESQNLLS